MYTSIQLRSKESTIAIVTSLRLYKFVVSCKLDYVGSVIFRLLFKNAVTQIALRRVNRRINNIVIKCFGKSTQRSICAEFLVFAQIALNAVLDYRLCMWTSEIVQPKQPKLE